MDRNVFIQESKLRNVTGRITYISSTAKQENLYAVYETTERPFWNRLAGQNQKDYFKSGSAGECIEARELIIALPEEMQQYDPNELLRDYVESFKNRYGVECIAALHHNKRKTNYHIHLIFSERKLLDKPVRKIAARNMFYDENGKHVRTKKEISTSGGELKPGCKIIKKGEPYEENFFEKKNAFFKSKAFSDEVKEFYVGKMNENMKDAGYKMKIFDKDGPYLHLKKIGKNNPNEKFIKENNKQRLIWNKNVSVALSGGIPTEILKEVKRVEIIEPIKEAMKNPEAAGMVVRIISRAIRTLIRFISDLIKDNAVDKTVPGTDKFYEALDYSRAPMRTRNSKEKEWER